MISRKYKFKPEERVQFALLHWLKLHHRPAYECVIKIDNEGKRSPMQGAKAKLLGLHVGASDLFIAYPTLDFNGLFIELKKEGYKLTPSNLKKIEPQMAFIEKMKSKGYHAELVIGVDHGLDVFRKYFKIKD